MKKMKDFIHQYAVRLRIYPSFEQKDIIRLNSNASRYIYNKAVSIDKELYQLNKIKRYLKPANDRKEFLLSIKGNVKRISNLSPFLNDPKIDAQAKANALQNYIKAWNNFKKNPNSKVPTFHKKTYEERYQTNPHYYKDGECNVRILDKDHITLPILGKIRFNGSKKMIDLLLNKKDYRFGTITISKDSVDKYYISLNLASDTPFRDTLPKTGTIKAYDVNLENFYTDSDGYIEDNPKYLKKLEHKLKINQRRLSKRYEMAKRENKKLYKAKNYQKQRKRVAKIHYRISSLRNEFLNYVSKREIKNNDILIVEDLKVKNLLKNHHLAKSISDVSWSYFFTLLKYKAELYGKIFIKVSPNNTTQTCSNCGYILKDEERLTLKDREWICPNCNTHHIRDYNAALNILNKGLKELNI